MIKKRQTLLCILVIPIVILALLTAYKKYVLSVGREVILPISGYDPRDLLSGHYLIYQIGYGTQENCRMLEPSKEVYYVLNSKEFSETKPTTGSLFIRGHCQHGRFRAGIERYYVPESKALELEKQIRSNQGQVVLSVLPSGHAQVKDLIINGVRLRTQ